MRMRLVIAAGLVALMGVAWADDMPPVIGGDGATLKDLVGKDTLVSVVLKERGAVDRNLKVVDIGPNYFAVVSSLAERTSYMFSSVAEVRVQKGRVETKKFTLDETRSLGIEEQKVLDRAFERAREVFQAADSEQGVKIRAATLLAFNGVAEAREYLKQLMASNDVETQIDVALRVYLAGGETIPGTLIGQGLQSGNRKVKAKAAKLAGLVGEKSAIPMLTLLSQDRISDISVPAAVALVRLNCREIIPTLMKMLTETDELKGEAAIFGLSRLGGPEVIEQLKAKLKDLSGQVLFRAILVLYNLGDAQGKDLLPKQMEQFPTLAPEAALVLARDGNWDAVQYLVDRLAHRYDEEVDVMTFRAKAASALIENGDTTAVSHLQELLRTDKPAVKREICSILATLGKRKLILVLQPLLESAKDDNASRDLAIQAATAVVAIAKPDFRERLIEIQS